MAKTKVNVRQLVEKYQQNCARIEEMADMCEKEQRERNEAENAEFETLRRENQVLQMKLQAAQAMKDEPVQDADTQLRELMKNRKEARIILVREIQTTAALADTGIIPVQQQEMLKPLRAGLIWDKVGITIKSGCVGKLRWPSHGKATAAWADEAAKLTDSKIDFKKLEMTGKRLGIAIPVTREELYDSEGVVENVINAEMPAAVSDAINEAMFNLETTAPVKGPFVDSNVQSAKTTFAGEVPTRAELLAMKAKVAGSGIKLVAPCWVMTEDMKALLENEKVDAGSGRFLCEDDKVLGYPVFTTPNADGYVGFGDWSYQAAGFFGPMEIIVDPYTLARNNATDFVLNARFGTTTLYPEAFALGVVNKA